MGKHSFFWVKLGMRPLKLIFLEKMSPVLRVSTHIYAVSKEIDGKMFISWVNLGNWFSNQSSCKIEPCSEGFNTHVWGFKEVRWENVHFSSKPRHVTLKSIVLEKWDLFWGFQHTFMGFPRKIDGKLTLKSIIWEKWALFRMFQHTFMGFPMR